MTKKELIEILTRIQGEDERIAIVYQDPDGEGDAEEGDILEFFDSGYNPITGHILYVKKR